MFAGDVLIRTKNSLRFDPTNPQVVLTVTSNVPVNVLIYYDAFTNIESTWLEANGFPHNGTGDSYETPTAANPTSSSVFIIRKKAIGLSGTATIGPNVPTSNTCGLTPAADCNPMYWLIVRPADRSVF